MEPSIATYRTGIPGTKTNMAVLLILIAMASTRAQLPYPLTYDSMFTTYYHQRLTHFRSLPQVPDAVIFLGNSITDGGEWQELFKDPSVLNRGISGDNATGVFHRLTEITVRQPRKVFLLIGINDLAKGTTPDSVFTVIRQIAQFIRQKSSKTVLYVQSVLPVNDSTGKFPQHVKRGEAIRQLNHLLQTGASTANYRFLDLYPSFGNDSGKLRLEFTNDGLHLTAKGYQLWKSLVFPFVYDLPEKPSLIPAPRHIKWNKGVLFLSECTSIRVEDSSFYRSALLLQEQLAAAGFSYPVRLGSAGKDSAPFPEIRLTHASYSDGSSESYELACNSTGVDIQASTETGLFRGITTLLQLARDQTSLLYCEIKDQPAFTRRGFLIDVGRNYVSVKGLKSIINQMARYKLNVFHFHVTENIAWRIEVPGFPQLTAPATQTRNKGSYYSVAEIRDLIQYCNKRQILFLPEVDMPGHSAAFQRATGFDMQSDSGKVLLKRILGNLLDTYGFSELHIGADEVKIRDTTFLPEMTAFLERRGIKVYGWQPGGNFRPSVIRQLWVGGPGVKKELRDLSVIDSKHLYINHMDPLESVISIYMRSILDTSSGSGKLTGATLCLWHDRALHAESDLWLMNPLYPALISFAERSWIGGGPKGWRSSPEFPGEPRQTAFDSFEIKLMEHRRLYFSAQPFPYEAQRDVTWKLIGPFPNKGNLTMPFKPELEQTRIDSAAGLAVRGGTVILRHWWYPLVPGVLPDPQENTTWYAYRRIWSDSSRMGYFWAGFNDMSRSVATTAPEKGEWDRKGSTLWWNGEKVSAPDWKNSGYPADLETPLTDEGYTYRAPLILPLHRGWNTILVKCPVGSFKPVSGQEPVKWMFTFIETSAK